jgi:uncharacterized protein YndB with AHSA1/START domain
MKNHHDPSYGQYSAAGEVRFVRLLPGPIERVWEFLTDPKKRATWFAGGEIELRVGGRIDFFFRHANLDPHGTPPEEHKQVQDPGWRSPGRVIRCEPPRVLSFLWGEEGEASEVTFELSPQGDHVQLLLVHRAVRGSRDELKDVGPGWHTHLAILAARLQGTPPPPLWTLSASLKPDYAALVDALPPAAP